jgi:hypothetical protein
MCVSQGGKSAREERLIKALRDNLRRRKASLGDVGKSAAKAAGEADAASARKRPAEPKRPS